MEDKEDERLAVEPEKKVVGQGTCKGFSQKDVDKILQEFCDILDPEPGLTDWVQMRVLISVEGDVGFIPTRREKRNRKEFLELTRHYFINCMHYYVLCLCVIVYCVQCS